MRIPTLHRWDLDPVEARALQDELADRVDTATPIGPWETIAGADASYDLGGDTIFAGLVVVRARTLEVVERVGAAGPAAFPYVPGLLSFREAPTLLEAFSKLKTPPDLVMFDGQGIAHPRRLGIASHVGLWLDRPTIGCAKSLLCGRYREPGSDRGDRSPLVDRGEVIGAVLRTRRRVKPVFVSPGHRCDLEGAVEAVLATCPKYRLPVPIRLAHDYVNVIRRAVNSGEAMPE
ncbi:deoxyribonuclease V [soil metagenome]